MENYVNRWVEKAKQYHYYYLASSARWEAGLPDKTTRSSLTCNHGTSPHASITIYIYVASRYIISTKKRLSRVEKCQNSSTLRGAISTSVMAKRARKKTTGIQVRGEKITKVDILLNVRDSRIKRSSSSFHIKEDSKCKRQDGGCNSNNKTSKC